MSEQIREQISAFLDGELPEAESELLLKRLSRDAELREVFGRYALMAEVVRTPEGGPLARSFVAGIHQRLDAEAPAAAPMAATVARARRWWRPLAGAAVAAGVAAVAVVTLEQRAELPLRAAASPEAVSAPAPAAQPLASAPVRVVASAGSLKPREDLSYTVPALPADNAAALPAARLTNYVFAHSKYSSLLGQRNVLSGLMSDQPAGTAVAEPAADAADAAAPSSVPSAQP